MQVTIFSDIRMAWQPSNGSIFITCYRAILAHIDEQEANAITPVDGEPLTG